jgi:hypothetical protein
MCNRAVVSPPDSRSRDAILNDNLTHVGISFALDDAGDEFAPDACMSRSHFLE